MGSATAAGALTGAEGPAATGGGLLGRTGAGCVIPVRVRAAALPRPAVVPAINSSSDGLLSPNSATYRSYVMILLAKPTDSSDTGAAAAAPGRIASFLSFAASVFSLVASEPSAS